MPEDDPTNRNPDITLANNILNWQPKYDLKDGLKHIIHYFQMEKQKLNKEVLKVAKKIASKSNLTIKIGKQAFYKQLEMPLRKAYAYTSKMMTINMMALDAKEGISAFLEKRKPKWKNK